MKKKIIIGITVFVLLTIVTVFAVNNKSSLKEPTSSGSCSIEPTPNCLKQNDGNEVNKCDGKCSEKCQDDCPYHNKTNKEVTPMCNGHCSSHKK